MSVRPVKQIIHPKPTLEGAGVRLQRGFGFGAVAPVGAWIADAAQVTHGYVDPRVVVRRACFDEQHAARRIRAQTIGEQAARSARADDHVVVCGIAQAGPGGCRSPRKLP